MTIIKVTNYQTSDGRSFPTLQEAEMHEIKQNVADSLAEIMRPAVIADRADAVIMSMINNHESVRAVLAKYAVRTAKRRKTLAAMV